MLSMEILFFLDHTSHVINNRMLLDEEDDRKLFFNALLHELTYSHEILIEFLIWWKHHNCKMLYIFLY